MSQLTNSIAITVLSAVLSFIMAWFFFSRKSKIAEANLRAAAVIATDKRVNELEQKLAALTSAVTPLSAAMKAVFIKELTHFHTPELDELLVRVADDTITEKEEPRLFELLYRRATELDGAIPESERDVAIMFPMMRKRVKAEKLLTATEIQVVSMPAAPPE